MAISREKYTELTVKQFSTLNSAFKLFSWAMKLVVLCYKRSKPITMLSAEVSQKLLAMGILIRLDRDRLTVSEVYEKAIGKTTVSELILAFPDPRCLVITDEKCEDSDRTSLTPPVSGVQMIGSALEEEEPFQQRFTA